MITGTMRMKSRALNQQVSYSITVPEAWNSAPGPYSVLYLLHGGADDHMVWLTRSNIIRYVSKMQLPLMIVMPYGGKSFWLNVDETQRYEDYLIDDLPSHLLNTFNIKPGKAAIGGASMGGFGAMRIALRYPERFASVWSHSSIFWTRDRLIEDAPSMSTAFDSDIFEVAERAQGRDLPVISFDCGLDDIMLDHNRRFHQHLIMLGIKHTYIEQAGAHDWDYWDLHVQEALSQHAQALGICSGLNESSVPTESCV